MAGFRLFFRGSARARVNRRTASPALKRGSHRNFRNRPPEKSRSSFPCPIPLPLRFSRNFRQDYVVTVGKTLTAKLTVTNNSQDQDFTFENCLHTYFHVGDIGAVSVTGLKGAEYLDKTENFSRKTEQVEHAKISRETDRIYLNTTAPVEIHDSKLGRRIRIEKSGSSSTVLWNPWVEKAQAMPDFGGDEYLHMVCVESGNVADNRVTLPAGKSSTLQVEFSTLPL